MTGGKRIALVVDEFWPHLNCETAHAATSIAASLTRQRGIVGPHQRGVDESHSHDVDVIAYRHRGSPPRYRYRNIRVSTPTRRCRSEWGLSRHIRSTAQSIATECPDHDVFVAVGGRDAAAAMIEAAKKLNRPSIVHLSIGSGHDDIDYWASRNSRYRFERTFASADRIVVFTESQRRRLCEMGFPVDRIVVRSMPPLPPAGEPLTARTVLTRTAARRVLAGVNGDLRCDSDAVVLLADPPMTRNGPIDHWITTLPSFFYRRPESRLWILGDGPTRDRIHDDLNRAGIRDRVAIPGTFSNLADVVAAADLMVHADPVPGPGLLMHALVNGLPIASMDTHDNRRVLEFAKTPVHWIDPASSNDGQFRTDTWMKLIDRFDRRSRDRRDDIDPRINFDDDFDVRLITSVLRDHSSPVQDQASIDRASIDQESTGQQSIDQESIDRESTGRESMVSHSTCPKSIRSESIGADGS